MRAYLRLQAPVPASALFTACPRHAGWSTGGVSKPRIRAWGPEHLSRDRRKVSIPDGGDCDDDVVERVVEGEVGIGEAAGDGRILEQREGTRADEDDRRDGEGDRGHLLRYGLRLQVRVGRKGAQHAQDAEDADRPARLLEEKHRDQHGQAGEQVEQRRRRQHKLDQVAAVLDRRDETHHVQQQQRRGDDELDDPEPLLDQLLTRLLLKVCVDHVHHARDQSQQQVYEVGLLLRSWRQVVWVRAAA
eukprot:scaffold27977_cov112-Isochrysis_galbana.AAC.1